MMGVTDLTIEKRLVLANEEEEEKKRKQRRLKEKQPKQQKPVDVSTLTNKRVIRRPEVKARTGLKDTALTDAIERGEFPAPIQVTDSGRTCVWLEEEVDEWLAARIAKREHDRVMKRRAR
jgi:prophage regulatory protein